MLLGLTWLPRRVWLDDPEKLESSCISCGSREPLVRRSVFAATGSTKSEKDGPHYSWCDPHVIYMPSAKGDTRPLLASDTLNRPGAAVGHWATVVAGMLQNDRIQPKLSVADRTKVYLWMVGFSTVQNDKYLEATERLVPVFDPNAIHDLPQSIERFMQWDREGSSFASKVGSLSTRNKSSRKHPEIAAAITAIRPHVEDRVSAKTNELIAGADEAWEQARSDYQPMMEVIARSLAPGFTTEAIMATDRISRARPNIQSKAKRKTTQK